MLRLRRRLRELPDHLRELRERHRARAHDLLVTLDREYVTAEREHYERIRGGAPYEVFDINPLSLPAGQRLKREPDDVLVSVFVTALTSGEYRVAGAVVGWLERKQLSFAPEDVELALHYALGCQGHWWFVSKLAPAVAAAERLAKNDGLGSVRPLLERAQEAVERDHPSDPQRTRLRSKLRELLVRDGELDVGIFEKKDDWGRRMRRKIGRNFDGAGVNDVLLHFSKATSARPSAKWRTTTAELAASTPRFDELVLAMLEELPRADVVITGRWEFEGEVFHDTVFLTDANSTLARGAVWSLLDIEVPRKLDLLRQLVETGLAKSYKLANACIYVLGEIGDRDSLVLLSSLRANVKDKSVLKQVDKALAAAAERSGMPASELRETLVPDFELDAEGEKTVSIGDASAVVMVEDARHVTVSWRDGGGKSLRSPPQEIRESHAGDIRALKGHVKEIRDALATERTRIENLFAEERRWAFRVWRERYLVHPLMAPFGRGLIWTFALGDREVTALASDGHGLVSVDGNPVEAPDDAEVRLWHPIDADPEDVPAWRRFLGEHRISQPFKQAYREVYLVAPAERETRTYSNRFAAHVVRYPQAYALMKSRGWSVVALGPYDNDGGRQWRDFGPHGIRAEFWMEHADEDWEAMDMLASLATTDQVRFTAIGGDEPIPLEDVPAIIFSEAMRDVDLFVGVASIAADPTWEDRGGDRFYRYWEAASFGDLGETAKTRRAVLTEIVPQLRIADRCDLTDRFLVVRGDLRTYKIHLGSGNVLMEPNDEYLCIVPGRSKAVPGNVFLPFEDDQRLSVILSKAFLLAEDRKIRDETITLQIRRG
jgi:hypothetical protein